MALQRQAYKRVLKPLLFRTDPEKAHRLFTYVGEHAGRWEAARWLVDRMYGYHGPDITRTVDGLNYRTPIVLAAGFDYNGQLTQILRSVGFGGVEVGSVTAYPTEGNRPPRLRRAVKSRSIIVNKGLRNDGVDRVIARLKRRGSPSDFVVGVSIAMTNAPSSATLEGAIDDYATSFIKVNQADVGDYLTVNISCPNVHGGESFTAPDRLRRLLERLDEIPCTKPLYAKMPINVQWEQFRELLDLLRHFQFSGVIIGNLNKDYESLDEPEEAPQEYRGGLSGRPTFKTSNDLICKTRAYCGSDFTIMGCGGVMSPEDARRKMQSGADLIQLISGMIFEGPHLMKDIAWDVARNPAAYTYSIPARRDLAVKERHA